VGAPDIPNGTEKRSGCRRGMLSVQSDLEKYNKGSMVNSAICQHAQLQPKKANIPISSFLTLICANFQAPGVSRLTKRDLL